MADPLAAADASINSSKITAYLSEKRGDPTEPGPLLTFVVRSTPYRDVAEGAPHAYKDADTVVAATGAGDWQNRWPFLKLLNGIKR